MKVIVQNEVDNIFAGLQLWRSGTILSLVRFRETSPLTCGRNELRLRIPTAGTAVL